MSEHFHHATCRASPTSGTPARLLDELYLRLLADLEEGKARIRARDSGGKSVAISHALAIIEELTAALDRQSAPALCSNLSSLYGFVSARLLSANLRMEEQPLDDAARVIRTLRDAFSEATQK